MTEVSMLNKIPIKFVYKSIITNPYERYSILRLPPKGLKAYDGTPIIIVTGNESILIPQMFSPGTYGFDTESNCKTGDLKTIQIYDGSTVYIFFAEDLLPEINCTLTKFLASKNKIKVGVDIEGDQRKLVQHFDKVKKQIRYETGNYCSFRLSMNGFLDLQNVARINEEPLLSLNKLSYKYVDDFTGNPSQLGTFLNPTNEQYIYAANDAILSLKITNGLMMKIPCSRWLREYTPINLKVEKEEFFTWIFPIISKFSDRTMDSLINQTMNSYSRWNSKFNDINRRGIISLMIEDFIKEGCFNHNPITDIVSVNTKESNSEKVEEAIGNNIIEDYDKIIEFLREVTMNEPPKKKVSFINQLCNSYQPWSDLDIEIKSHMALDCINEANVVGDMVQIDNKYKVIKRNKL